MYLSFPSLPFPFQRLRSLLFLAAVCPLLLSAQALNPKPIKALGAPRLTATQSDPFSVDSVSPNYVEGRELASPTGVALDNSTSPPILYVSDTGNNRVLGWKNSAQFASGVPADLVVGQLDKFSTLPQGPSSSVSTGLTAPTGLAVDKAGNLYVADSGNNRILRFPRPFAQPDGGRFPDLVLGQSSFAGNAPNPNGLLATSLFLNPGGVPHTGLAFDPAGNLYASDPGNHRVLRYPAGALSAARSGTAADMALGQNSLIASVAPGGDRASKTYLNTPAGIAVDSSGRVFVADGLSRVLVYQAPFVSGTAATRILGIASQQPNQPPAGPVTDTGFGFVQGVTLAAGRPVVVDASNSRVLIYDPYDLFTTESASFSPSAKGLIGQALFTDKTANRGQFEPSSQTLNSPLDAAYGNNEIYVADTGNNRVLVFPYQPGGTTSPATRVIGQLGMNFSAPNLIEGKEFTTSANGLGGAVLIDRTSTPVHLYVADPGNNRVLGFRDYPNVKAGDVADLVIGQPDVYRAVANYPGNLDNTPTNSSLLRPTGLAMDAAGNLYVADTGNGRVLRFPRPFDGAKTLPPADLVLGQANFTSRFTDPTSRSMRQPYGLAFTAEGTDASGNVKGGLLVSDSGLNRVLYFPKPFSSGMSAQKVLGQTDFNSLGTSTNAALNPAVIGGPRMIATDSQDRVYVTDPANGRVAIFDTVANLPNFATPALSLNGLGQPVGVAVSPANSSSPGQVWVAESNGNRLLHYPNFDQLIVSSAPDAAVPVIRPVSVTTDNFEDVVAADGANRVLEFVPQLSVVNGASFLTRPLAPGTIISIFPASTNNPAPLAADTASFDSLPNPLPVPNLLADVQVLVNQQPTPLFYVSPNQINATLSSTLPTSGTAEVRVVRKSTGQVYGTADVSLATASPGLFTLGSTGTGQVAALNMDNTVNVSNNPVVRGQVVQLFGTGQGLVPGAPPDGNVATGLLPTASLPRVVIGNVTLQDSDVQYSGLAPNLVGVWQINLRVPPEVTSGSAVPVIIYQNSIPNTNPAAVGQIRTTISIR